MLIQVGHEAEALAHRKWVVAKGKRHVSTSASSEDEASTFGCSAQFSLFSWSLSPSAHFLPSFGPPATSVILILLLMFCSFELVALDPK